jgi:DNA-directed RNA polymerase specialized sigma subunit
MILIKNLIKKKNMNIYQRDKINKILYNYYENWAIKQALEFKKLHYFKCKNLNKDDLIVSSKFGLFKAIKNYNGNSSFIYFSSIYIKGELLKTLTSHFSFSIVPKTYRITNKQNFSKNELIEYKNNLSPTLIGYSEYWRFDKINDNIYYNENKLLNKINSFEKYKNLWDKINSLEPFSMRTFHLKFDEEFNIIRSNKEISILMCCSEETIRKTLLKYSIIVTKS